MSGQFVQEVGADEAFSALADEVRVSILRSLRAAEDRAVSFSTLQDEVGIADSGRFNYHLGKLTDRFVRKTDEGYALTQAGKSIVGAIESGAYTVSGQFEPIRLDEPCGMCGDTQRLSYRDERVSAACTSCPASYEFVVPPVVFADCDRAEIPRLASRYLRTIIRRQHDGFCSFCDAPVTPAVTPLSEVGSTTSLPDDLFDASTAPSDVPWVEFDCRQCGSTTSASVWDVLVEHPAVVSFYTERGVDVRERYCWAFPRANDVDASIQGREPFRAETTYTYAGESLSVRVDERLSVVATEVTPADG